MIRIQAFFILSMVFLWSSYGNDDIIVRSNPKRFHVKSIVTVAPSKRFPDSLVIAAAAPQSSLYQDISKFSFSTGEIYLFPQDNGKYIYASFDRKQKGTHLIREFDVTLYDIQTDWSKITPSIKPSGTNQIFTKAAGPYIDPNHPKISSIRKSLSKKVKIFWNIPGMHICIRYGIFDIASQ